jgi:hypothetical protein
MSNPTKSKMIRFHGQAMGEGGGQIRSSQPGLAGEMTDLFDGIVKDLWLGPQWRRLPGQPIALPPLYCLIPFKILVSLAGVFALAIAALPARPMTRVALAEFAVWMLAVLSVRRIIRNISREAPQKSPNMRAGGGR